MDDDKTMENSGGEGTSEHVVVEQVNSHTEEKSPEKCDTRAHGKNRKKRKHPLDVNAPRLPLTGYIRFYNSRRNIMRVENPDMTYQEITKILALEWASLEPGKKQTFLDDAEKEREVYQKQLEEYKKTESYKAFQKELCSPPKKKLLKKNKKESVQERRSTGTDIMIFTEDFLQHNRLREAELRDLRKETIELEEQNATLAKHVENLKSTVTKLEIESVQQRNTNSSLRSHTDKIKTLLGRALSSFKMPYNNESIDEDNVETFLLNLSNSAQDPLKDIQTLIPAVRTAISKINFKNMEKM